MLDETKIKMPRIKVFVYNGRVENIYADTCLLDIEVIECERPACKPSFEEQYEIAEAAGLEEANYKTIVCDSPYRSDED